MVAESDFSGLVSSACALASAPAIAPIVSLDRCMTRLRSLHEVEADGAGLGALGAHAMPEGLFGVLGHDGFKLGPGSLVVEKGLLGLAVDGGELAPRVRAAHVDDAHRRNARTRRL